MERLSAHFGLGRTAVVKYLGRIKVNPDLVEDGQIRLRIHRMRYKFMGSLSRQTISTNGQFELYEFANMRNAVRLTTEPEPRRSGFEFRRKCTSTTLRCCQVDKENQSRSYASVMSRSAQDYCHGIGGLAPLHRCSS